MTRFDYVRRLYRARQIAEERCKSAGEDKKRFWTKIKEKWIIYSIVILVVGHILAFLFPYEIKKRTLEYYDAKGAPISTYVCYTTEYGDCYHAKYCGYLWNSSYKTTVYEARENGYFKCSKCTPNVATTYYPTVTKSRYKTQKIDKYAVCEFCFIALCAVVVIKYVHWLFLNSYEVDAYEQYKSLSDEWDSIPEHIKKEAFK